jgi:hypothetical protein
MVSPISIGEYRHRVCCQPRSVICSLPKTTWTPRVALSSGQGNHWNMYNSCLKYLHSIGLQPVISSAERPGPTTLPKPLRAGEGLRRSDYSVCGSVHIHTAFSTITSRDGGTEGRLGRLYCFNKLSWPWDEPTLLFASVHMYTHVVWHLLVLFLWWFYYWSKWKRRNYSRYDRYQKCCVRKLWDQLRIIVVHISMYWSEL